MKIIVPESLRDITLDQWMACMKTDDVFEQVAILCNITADEVRRFELESFDMVQGIMSDIENPSETKWELVPRFELDGTKFGIVPNLSELSVGEFADLETACANINEDPRKVLAILYRRVVEDAGSMYRVAQYTGFEPVERMGKVSVATFYGVLDFFLSIGASFTRASLQSLKGAEGTKSPPNGAGMQSSIISPMGRR